MAKKFPIIGHLEMKDKNTQAKCIVCGELAKRRVHIQFDIFRGDDEVVWSCMAHRNDLDALCKALIAVQLRD